MLRISKLADYGTIVMVYLAKKPDELCNARDIALHTHLKIPTVSKILKCLTAQGLLSSVRGVAGGYRLKKPAKDISVTEIIYALEDNRGITECSLQPNECALQHVCHVQGNWQLISNIIMHALEGVTLELLAKPTISKVDLKQINFGVV